MKRDTRYTRFNNLGKGALSAVPDSGLGSSGLLWGAWVGGPKDSEHILSGYVRIEVTLWHMCISLCVWTKQYMHAYVPRMHMLICTHMHTVK